MALIRWPTTLSHSIRSQCCIRHSRKSEAWFDYYCQHRCRENEKPVERAWRYSFGRKKDCLWLIILILIWKYWKDGSAPKSGLVWLYIINKQGRAVYPEESNLFRRIPGQSPHTWNWATSSSNSSPSDDWVTDGSSGLSVFLVWGPRIRLINLWIIHVIV